MCNKACLDFGKAVLAAGDVKGKAVIEVGSLDVNGSLRHDIEASGPTSYVGVDIQAGRGVDRICRVEDLITRFGRESFDVVLCTELLEHVEDWRIAIHNLKTILKPGGALLITTRSRGFEYHGYPYDFWRYEITDMRHIFADLDIEKLQSDAPEPGVFFFARKPADFAEKDLRSYALYSIVLGARSSVARNSLYWSLVCFPLRKIFGKRRWINSLKK